MGEIADHYAEAVRSLAEPPVLIGHSFGGLVAQLLLDRGLGAAGVAIAPPAPKGVWRLPRSAIKAASPALLNPFNYWRTVQLTFPQFRYAFANAMDEADARVAYERYAVPGPGRPLFQAATANLNPFAATRVDFRNPRRPPLLLVAGVEDHTVPAAVVRCTHARYTRAGVETAYAEFAGRCHLIIAQDGWREVAEHVADWAEAQLPAVATASGRGR